MRRYVGAELEQFERLFERAAAANVRTAAYPGACSPSSGPLRFRRVKAGGLIVEVERCEIEDAGDFLVDVLFSTGSCLFPDAIELARFWNGPLAEAFGLPVGPLPEHPEPPLPEPELLEQLSFAPAPAPPSPSRRRKRLPTAAALAAELGAVVHGQELALGWLAELVTSQLGKRLPRRPATALLIGSSGVGKTSTAEALPDALAAAGWKGLHLHRVDCAELTSSYDVHRFLGANPGTVGYTPTPPLVAALQKGSRILLFDEIDKAHEDVREPLYALLDSGRITAPDGRAVAAPGTIILLTSADGADELATRLHRVEPHDRLLVDREVRAQLREQDWPPELLGRIDTIAFFRPLAAAGRRSAAEHAIATLAEEYGFTLVSSEPVLADVVVDLAEQQETGARGLYYAARRLLGDTFARAAADGVQPDVSLEAGPPPTLVRASIC